MLTIVIKGVQKNLNEFSKTIRPIDGHHGLEHYVRRFAEEFMLQSATFTFSVGDREFAQIPYGVK